jgi:hypothetical protein
VLNYDMVAWPGGDWGYFKVPGCWPGVTDYMQKDSQAVYATLKRDFRQKP